MLPPESPLLASVLITNTHTNPEHIGPDQLSACKLMIHPNSGYDNYSAEFIKNAHFPIVIGNPIRAQAVVNYILSALLSHYSPLASHQEWDRSRKWPRKLLSELNILILGNGHIGGILNKSLSPLCLRVDLFDPHQGLSDLNLHHVDVVILSCSLNAQNNHLINKEFLTQMKSDFLLINTARGSLVHTEDLIEVLKKRPQAFAVLDVFEEEPCDLTVFKEIKNTLVTSHIAGVYQNIDAATASFEATVIQDFSTQSTEEFLEKYKSMILKNRLSRDGFLI